MAIRIVNKIGVSDTEDELLLTVQSDGTIVYCSDTLNTFIYIGGSWLNFDNQKVYENSPIPASVIVEDSSNRLVSDSEKTTWNNKQPLLVSATNIKTINGNSILGSGNLVISGGIEDGDKGDITVSGSGDVWTIDNLAVTNAKINDIAATKVTEDSTHRFATDSEKTTWNAKQDALVSATNIKTINGSSILGSGDLTVSGSGLAQFQVRQLTRR
jgi:hypothetical protein